ncbi:16S rRNA (uracil(1498)-N(3))-methyltransferase [Comamonas sp. NLF-1-9]|uniref:16S rRNA (uracil(1498)-N(3))-methyltransferase n=1 Tax=Comamonas sp. NLF-1-9 TaxID=2853163 RepID=UPI001C492C5E|nr:16S rRNA (uracil(1498)-N(3))-methyltransferase [Comamonas sp. NLF-1-9]QXL83969.1 16S rRNA (uracil(1498)-N(3))-methyltransferase [Comamonas sp. NLF-1-9]
MPRVFCAEALAPGELRLGGEAARHLQVLRLQPGDALTLFDGRGGEWAAQVTRMGRSEVWVEVGAHADIEREAARALHLIVGMPANERMDWLVEKATELGVAGIQPVITQRSVLRLEGERAAKRLARWQAIAAAACEQCGRNRLPRLGSPLPLEAALQGGPAGLRVLLSLQPGSRPLRELAGQAPAVSLLLGPEGGLTPQEEGAALALGFAPAHLGARVLRSETAALAAAAQLMDY